MLEVKNVKKSFDKLNVLKGISFNVEKGEVISVIGPSGCGKSTLIRVILLLLLVLVVVEKVLSLGVLI